MVAFAKTKPATGLAQPLKKYPLKVEAKDLKNLIINMKFIPAPEDDFHAHPEHYIFVAHHNGYNHKDYGFDTPYPASRNEQKRATGRRGKSMHIFASNIFKRSTIERVIPPLKTSPIARLAIKVSKGKSSSKKSPSLITPYNSHGYYKDGNNIQNWLQQNLDTPEYSQPSSRRLIKLSSSKNRATKVRTSPPKGKGSSKSNALRKNPRITHKLRKTSPLAIGKTKRTRALKGISKTRSPQRKAKTRSKMTKDKTTKENSSGTSTGTSSESSSKNVTKVSKDIRHSNSASDTSSGTSEGTSVSSSKPLATSKPQKRSPAINFKLKNPLVSDSPQTGRGLGRAKIGVLNTIFHKPKGTLLKSKLPQGKTSNKMSQLPGGNTATSRLRRRRGAISPEKELKVSKRVNNRKKERSLMTRAKPVSGIRKKVVSSKRPIKPKIKSIRLSEKKNNSSHPARYNKRALKSSPKQDSVEKTKVFQASTAVRNSKRLRKSTPSQALHSKPAMFNNRNIRGKNASHLEASNKKLNLKNEHEPLNSKLNLKINKSQSPHEIKKPRNIRHKLTAEVKSLSPKKVNKLSHARSANKLKKPPKRLRSQSPSKSRSDRLDYIKSVKAFKGNNKSPTSKLIRKSRSSSPVKNYGDKQLPTATNQQHDRSTQKRARSISAKDSPFVKHIIKAAKKPVIKSSINNAKSLPTSKKRTKAIKPIRQHQRLRLTKYKDKNIASSSNRKNDKDKKILSSSTWLNALPWPLSPNDTTKGDDTTGGNGSADGKINATDRYDSDGGESNFSSRLWRLLGFPEIKRRRSLKRRPENSLSNAKKKNPTIIKESSKRARSVQTGKPISKNVNASRSLVPKISKALKRKADILESSETSLNYSKKLHNNGDSISEPSNNNFPEKDNPGKISQTISSWIFHPFSSVIEPRENSLNLPSPKNTYVDGSMHSHSPNLSHNSVDIPIEVNFDTALLNVQESENNLAQGSNHGLNEQSSSEYYSYNDLYTNNITTTTKTITTSKIFTHDS